MRDRDYDELSASLSLIAAALLSISVVLWMLYFSLDDVTLRVRLVGVALRRWTPFDPRDRADVPPVSPVSPEPDAQSEELSREVSNG